MIDSTGMACAGEFCLEGNLHEASADYLLLDNLPGYLVNAATKHVVTTIYSAKAPNCESFTHGIRKLS